MAEGMNQELVLWCKDRLSSFLKFPVEDELVRYMLAMDSVSDLEEYLISLLGDETSELFLKELIPRWKPSHAPPPGDGDLMTPLVRLKQDDLVLFAEKKQKSKGKDKKGKSGAAVLQPPPGLSACHGSSYLPPTTAKPYRPPQAAPTPKPFVLQSDRKLTTTTTTKSKFVPLMSTEGKSRMAVHIPGRHPCNCLGQKHTLVNNCLECGRIVCSQEGPGPCLYCGAIVVTREDEGLLSRNSKKGNKLKEKLMKQYQIQDANHVLSIPSDTTSDHLSHAIEHKEKLLEFDKTSVQRTKVIDDESDYFSVDNRWLSDDHRRLLKDREDRLREEHRGAHRKTKLTLDIAGRRVIEEEEQFELYSEENVRDITKPTKASSNGTYEIAQDGICNPLLPIPPPQYVQGRRKKQVLVDNQKVGAVSVSTAKPSHQSLRIQDEKFLEMTDEGKCLSMHQPWASLLVCGIKLHEGRTWYTPHRGKLWIAATVKQPDRSEISSVENFYKKRSGGDGIQFPSEYPTKCLLGCVHVTDCLAQDVYREKYRDGESESPYVFICQHPQQLFVKFPVSGKHKIWKVPSDIHLAAKRACQPLVVM